VAPLLRLTQITIDVWAVLRKILSPKWAGQYVEAQHDKHLFHGATLQDLPENPRFIITATSLQTRTLWRFQKPYAINDRTGQIIAPKIPLARAVAASSAFPPLLSPVYLDLSEYQLMDAADGKKPANAAHWDGQIVLTDGGVYDNLGLEPIW